MHVQRRKQFQPLFSEGLIIRGTPFGKIDERASRNLFADALSDRCLVLMGCCRFNDALHYFDNQYGPFFSNNGPDSRQASFSIF
jgi:hypothetical protein